MNATESFLKRAGRILNAGQTSALLLTGNVNDLFPAAADKGVDYVPLVDLLARQWSVADRIVMVYELNGPIRFVRPADRAKVREVWLKWRTGLDANALAIEAMLTGGKAASEMEATARAFDANMNSAVGSPSVALEILRQISLCYRTSRGSDETLRDRLIIIVEATDLIIPEGEIGRISDTDRHRVGIFRDWFSDPGFMNDEDSVVLIAESRSLLNHKVAGLPQILEVAVPYPDEKAREDFAEWFDANKLEDGKVRLWGTRKELAKFTAGLSIHALNQLLKGASYERRTLSQDDVIAKVEEYIQGQLGEDIVEFKKPEHTLEDVIGFTSLKAFLRKELIPRLKATGPEALTGAAVCGPIGGGKTFIFEAVASDLDMVVLVLKNIRSQWFGQTDVIFERLRRVLDALAKVLIFVDEADTQFGGVGAEVHDTERRLTGKIQAMMSDPALRGRVVWLLMTARIHLLSPDLRRPGRVGDLIIPVLDPDAKDREEFIRWALKPALKDPLSADQLERVSLAVKEYSAAGFSSIRSEIKAKASVAGGSLSFDEIMAIIDDQVPPAITEARRYQTLQALVNCTRRSLLPNPKSDQEERLGWEKEIRLLEAKGVK